MNASTAKVVSLLTVFGAILLRVLVGMFPYSGESDAPRFGDFEAQRHWMEITLNLPVKEWYANTEANDPEYWRLDYPPLTAYHELGLAYISRWVDPRSVVLHESRGFETIAHRQFVRMSVIVSELITYLAAVLLFVHLNRPHNGTTRAWWLLALCVNPVLVFIDHGHFQYNSVAIGFLIFAVIALQSRKPLVSAALYTCAFLFKQTLLYFAPMFFAYMLGEALQLSTWGQSFQRICLLGITVLITTFIIVFPLIQHCADRACVQKGVGNLLSRIFPFDRGVFEDYVSNVWIVLNPILRLRTMSPDGLRAMGKISTIVTLLGCSPSGWAVLRNPRSSMLPIAMTACSLSFYLFSWMVHEKAILLPLSTIILSIPVLSGLGRGYIVLRFTEAAIMSLWPLMVYDKCTLGGSAIGALGLIVMYVTVSTFSGIRGSKRLDLLNVASILCNGVAFIGICLYIFVAPPVRFPYLWPFVISAGCCGTFVASWLGLTLCLLSRSEKKLE